MDGEMNYVDVPETSRVRGALRVATTIASVLLLPPFILLAIAPMLLLLAPVALIGVPFIIPALVTGSLAARSEDKLRASWRPPVPRAVLRQRTNFRVVN